MKIIKPSSFNYYLLYFLPIVFFATSILSLTHLQTHPQNLIPSVIALIISPLVFLYLFTQKIILNFEEKYMEIYNIFKTKKIKVSEISKVYPITEQGLNGIQNKGYKIYSKGKYYTFIEHWQTSEIGNFLELIKK